MDNKDKQALIDGTATIPYKLHILNDDGSIKDTLTEEDIVSTDYEDYRYVDSSSLCIGQFVARKLKGEIKTIDKDLQIEDKEISVEMGVNRNDGSKVYDITIDGKSEQETRSGKNLLKNTNVNSGDNNYWSSYSTFNEITNTLTRSTTATTESYISHRLNGIKSGTQYTLSLEAKSNGYVKHMDLYCYNSSVSGIKSKLRIPLTTDYQKITWTFTTDSSIDYSTNSMIRIDNNGSTTSGTEAILTVRNVMLVEGTDTDFEPYGASPSPDYPSEIKTVKGIRNLFDKDNATILNAFVNGNSGLLTTPTNKQKSIAIKVEPNTQYTISGIERYSSNYGIFDDTTLTIGSSTATIKSNIKNGILTFTTGNNSKWFVFLISGGSETYSYNNVQLEEGSTSHDYVPYGSWLKVKDTGKNLWGKEEHGSIDESTGENIYNKNRWRMVDFVEVEGNTDYTLSTKTNTSNIYYIFYYYDKNYNFISSIALVNKTSATNKTPSNCKYMKCVIADTGSIKTTDRQLEQSSTATEYEPYQEQSTLIDMNKPNLFDGNEWSSTTLNGITYTNDGKGNIIANGKATSNSFYSINKELEAGTYTLCGSPIGAEPNKYLIQALSYGIGDTGIGQTFTLSSKTTVTFRIMIWNGITVNNVIFKPTLYKSENTTPYYELSSIGDTKDELNIDKDGNVSITQNIGEVVLNGSETINLLETKNNVCRYVVEGVIYSIGKTECKSNKFMWYENQATNTSFNSIDEQAIHIRDNNRSIGIKINKSIASSVDEFKTWLSNNPVTVKYILDKPQTISLGKYNKIESIDDTENITIQTNIDTTFTKISYNLINWYNLGNFLITKPTDDDVKDTLTFDSMDYTKKFNKPFDSSGITFPCTALQLAKYCCEKCGVELATNEFLNYDFEIIDNQYTNEDTFRNVMQDIGKLAYSWVRIGWDNKCYIDFNYGEEVDEYNKINNDNYYDLDLQQKQFGPVNRIVIGMSNVEGENVYIEDEKSIVEHGVTELQIYDNNLTYTPELRNKVIDSAKVLFGLTYTPMTLNTTGHPWLLGKEKVEVTGMNNTIYYTYPWDRTISYSGHIKSKLESKCDTKTETEYKYKGDVETVLKKTRIIVDKQENTITSLTQQTTSIQDNLQQNYYDITQTNQLIQTSSTGITNTFSEAGGNNIFRNTGLWFQETEENKWEYWTGTAKKTTNDKAVLGTSILLQSGQFAQEQEVPNGNYSISFYYKLLNPLAKATVKINDNTYELTSTDYKQFYTGEQDENKQYITFPIEVTATHLNISFKTDIDNSVEVYDLMANKGTVKLAYSQNENEVTTDTVNISKGITITSSTKDTKFKADSDGIRILNKTSDEKITEFTDKGMTTKEAIVEEEATIVKVLIQNIGDQTWFTRL